MGGDVPRTPEHDVEHLATLVVTVLGVRMVVYGLEAPFGLLEPHSILLVLFRVCLLFALLLAGRCAVATLLLQLLAVLFCELDLPALLSVVVCRVVHWTTHPSIIAARRLMGALVASGTSSPTRHSSSYCGGRSSGQWLVITAILLVLLFVLATTSLGSNARIGLGTLPHFWSRWGVPGTTLCGPSTFVRQVEKLYGILDVIRGELLQHLLIPHTLVKCIYNKSIGDMRNGVANLRELLNDGVQRFPWMLLHGVEIDLITRLHICTLEVDCELMA
jgi:hypothetical protein